MRYVLITENICGSFQGGVCRGSGEAHLISDVENIFSCRGRQSYGNTLGGISGVLVGTA